MRKLFLKWPLFLLFLTVCLMGNAKADGDNSGHHRLESCISEYKDGDYQRAGDSLQALLPLLADRKDRMEAFKYLGFCLGMLNRIDKSKAIFKSALEKYPGMEIDTLEVPPNIALIFKQAKLEKKVETLEASAESAADISQTHRVNKSGQTGPSNRVPVQVIVRKKDLVAPIVLLCAGIISAAGGADLFYSGYRQYRHYKSIDVADQNALNQDYLGYRNACIAGAACAAVTAVLLPVSIYLFVKTEPPEKGMAISFVNGSPSLVWLF
ncbi:MAG: hypothetical protein PHC61_00975 [Chitinivibrionales bacterium]|nr:hypothetical protein [Chitinivibrionales bacterium]